MSPRDPHAWERELRRRLAGVDPRSKQNDLERQAIFERLGWTFARIRGSLFFRDETRALAPVFRRLEEMKIAPELVAETRSPVPEQPDTVERVIRRAQELRAQWHQDQGSETQ